jgi:hypothetical protein
MGYNAQTGKPMSGWKEFEILNAKIQADVAPNATVESNKRILGKSGRQRQIDVAITEKIGLFPVLIVLECKNYRRPVGITRVEAFATKIADVGAQHGVMVSAKGFDAGARAMADRHGITLLTHRDATEADWNRVVGRQFWMRLVMSVCVRWSASAVVGGSSTTVFEANQVLWLADGREVSISNAVRPVLEMTRAARPVGEFVAWAVPVNPLFLDADRTIAVERLRVGGENKSWGLVINPTLASGHILQDALSDEERCSQLFTEPLDWKKLFESPQCRELTAAELAENPSQSSGALFLSDPSQLKQYLRLAITQSGRQRTALRRTARPRKSKPS